jgi:signal recognition particle receptor subunit beta
MLVAINKTDLKSKVTLEEIKKASIPARAEYEFVECSAVTSAGVQGVREWLSNHVQQKARLPE